MATSHVCRTLEFAKLFRRWIQSSSQRSTRSRPWPSHLSELKSFARPSASCWASSPPEYRILKIRPRGSWTSGARAKKCSARSISLISSRSEWYSSSSEDNDLDCWSITPTSQTLQRRRWSFSVVGSEFRHRRVFSEKYLIPSSLYLPCSSSVRVA